MKDEIDINQQVISLYSHLRKEFDQINISQNFFFFQLTLSRIFHMLLLFSLKMLHVLLMVRLLL